MSLVKFDISMSLDGHVAGPDPGPDQGLGAGGEQLHEWVTATDAWRESHGLEGGESGPDADVMAETMKGIGAEVMGRGKFSAGSGPWEDDPVKNGWWGDEPPFRMPVFVVTHHEREPLELGETTFSFVTEGVEAAIAQAREAAGDADVAIGGGASVAQQALAAGLVDEMQLHVVPVILGGGRRLFENLEPGAFGLELDRVIDSPAVTHLRYRVTG